MEASMAEFTPITTQEAFNEAIRERLERERAKYADYDSLKAQATELKKFQDAKYPEQITALQDQLKTAQEAAGRAAAAEGELLKIQVAARHGIPLELAGRLSGNDESELDKDADTMAGFLKTPGAPPLAQVDPPVGKNTNRDRFAEWAKENNFDA